MWRWRLWVLSLIAAAGTTAATFRVQGLPNGVRVLDPDSGAVVWTWEGTVRLFAPVSDGEHVYLTGLHGVLEARALDTGRLRWRFETADDWLYPPRLFPGRVVVVGRHSGLHGLDSADGRERWRLELPQEPTESPLMLDRRGLVQACFDGTLLAVDASDGRVRWLTRLATPGRWLARDGDRLLLGGYEAALRVLDARNGHRLWRLLLPGRLVQAPQPVGPLLLLATDAPSLTVVDTARRRVLRHRPLAGEVVRLEVRADGDFDLLLRRGNTVLRQRVSLQEADDPAQAGILRVIDLATKREPP